MTESWHSRIGSYAVVRSIAERLRRGRPAFVTVGGATGSSGTILAGCLARQLDDRTMLFVVAHLDETDDAVDELRGIGLDAVRFPALEVLPGEQGVNPELLGERLGLARRFVDHRPPRIVVAPFPALMQSIPHPGALDDLCLILGPGSQRGPGAILQWLEAAGYARVDLVETAGEFAVRGGIIDIFPAGSGDDAVPIRLDFLDDELEFIMEIDLDTMASDRRIDEVQIVGASVDRLLHDEQCTGLWSLLDDKTVIVLQDLMEITEQGRGYYERTVSAAAGIFGPPEVFKALGDFTIVQIDHHPIAGTDPDATFDVPFAALPHFAEDVKSAVRELVELSRSGPVIVLCDTSGEKARLGELLDDLAHAHDEAIAQPLHERAGRIDIEVAYLHRGFTWAPPESAVEACFSVVPYHEILHRYQTRRRFRHIRAGRAMDTFLDIAPGDFVVHRDHGIARFVQLRLMDLKSGGGADRSRRGARAGRRSRAEQEYLTLEFAGGALLHVPMTKIDLVQKYIGGLHGKPPLSHLGGKKWTRQKEQVADAVKDLAGEMLRIQAARQHQVGIRYPHDTTWQTQFEAEFPYEETEDQLAAVIEIKKDMHDEQPMDRLLCGDVGFGKTELAIRAAFKAAEYGKQVAILVPTTVLAEQHGRTFRQRFVDYPFRVEVISRFQTAVQSRKILEALRRGQVDIIIGTHRLLSKDIKFADLGLVVIDEEQRFGVEHKQRLLQFRLTADVLTLSATPIPRTLHMALLGLRDISSLATPPRDRRAIVTEVTAYNPQRIRQAIQRELAREGQVYFVHNRVYNIQAVADDIQQLVPDARIIVGHGQMPDRELEQVMVKFIRHEADVLVSTTIIESGIDIPNANTIFINEADKFGLADLHQLRGRVGRYKHRAYCYLMLSPNRTVSRVAAKRLRAIEEYSMLGAGFKIAMRDLEIRGAGNLLGPEQSGHIAAVGYEMYCHLLEEAVKLLQNQKEIKAINTEVELGIAGTIPKGYIPSDMRRMAAYRRICQVSSDEDLEKVRADLTDAYGSPPSDTETLLQLAEIRLRAARLGVRSVTRHEKDVIFQTAQPEPILRALEGAQGTVRLVQPRLQHQLPEVFFRPPANYFEGTTILTVLRTRLAGSSLTPVAV